MTGGGVMNNSPTFGRRPTQENESSPLLLMAPVAGHRSPLGGSHGKAAYGSGAVAAHHLWQQPSNRKLDAPRRVASTYGTLPLNQEMGGSSEKDNKKRAASSELDTESSHASTNQSETESDSDSCGSSATQPPPPPVIQSILRVRSTNEYSTNYRGSLEKKNSSVEFALALDVDATDDEDDEYEDDDEEAAKKTKKISTRRKSCVARCMPRRLTQEEKADLYRVRPDLDQTSASSSSPLLRDLEELRRRRQRRLVFSMLGGTLIVLMMVVMYYVFSQGRYARAGALEDKDLDALMRGPLRPLWAWAWQNVTNAEDFEVIKRNVRVARHTIDSCKQERAQANKKQNELLNRKKYLQESLRQAREREQALLKNLRRVDRDQDALISISSEKKQRELLKRAFNDKNDSAMQQISELVQQTQALVAVTQIGGAASGGGGREETNNQVDILMAEVKRMLKSTNDAERVNFGDTDIAHLRDSSGSQLIQWILETASRPPDDKPHDDEESTYAAHVEQNSSPSHEALVQIQHLLRESQAQHLASFLKTQKKYVEAQQLKKSVQEALASGNVHYDLWGNNQRDAAQNNDNTNDNTLAAETVDLQIESQVQAVALNYASKVHDDVTKQVDTLLQQKQELDHKVELMTHFDDRQQELVAHIRAKFRQNQELLQSLPRKQERLLDVVASEMKTRVNQQSDAQVTLFQQRSMEELRAFSSLSLGKLETVEKQKALFTTTQDENTAARQIATITPLEAFYIHQLQDSASTKNGFQRVAQALGVAECKSWAAMLAQLAVSQEEETAATGTGPRTDHASRGTMSQLQQEMAHDRTQTVPDAHALLCELQQLTQQITSSSLPRLAEVDCMNEMTRQQMVPELQQAIDNWYHQPAWSAQLQATHGMANPQ